VFTRYTFHGHSGYILDPHDAQAGHNLVGIGHTAHGVPWTDPGVHLHRESEECYLLLQGELRFLVAGSLLTLRSREMLLVKPGIPHAIVGGEGPIEHFGIRTPALDDKETVGEIPRELPPLSEERERELRREWGYRIPLETARNQNCWLIGAGTARFQSPHMIFAFLAFPTEEAANAGIGTRHRLHIHQRSWEYYAAFEGTKTLQIEDKLVTIGPGEILEVPPEVAHTLHSRQAPYEGFTLRVPVELHDKIEC